MATQPRENNQPVVLEPFISTNPVLIDQTQSIPPLGHQFDTFIPHLLTPNTAASGHVADLQARSNLTDLHIENMPLLYSALGGPPTLCPLLPTQLWNGGNTPSCSQQEMAHSPVSVPKNDHYFPIQTQSVRPDHWDLPIDSNLDTIHWQIRPHVEAGASAVFRNSTASLGKVSQEYGSLPAISIAWTHEFRQPAFSQAAYRRTPSPRDTPPSKARSYNRPGREPAVKFEPDAIKLQASCERHRGSSFAVDWIVVVFKHGVTKEALLRPLDSNEVDQMDFPGGFEPRQAYDGFISKIGDWYECGLCKEGKETHWKNKKDAPRHLRKFHFGLGDQCRICAKYVYSNGEMRAHGCRPSAVTNK